MIGNGLAWFLAWLFARAALHKALAPGYYHMIMSRYAAAAGSALVWPLVVLEVTIVLGLLLPRWRFTGLGFAAALLLFYAGLMALQILRGRADMQCGCSGAGSPLQVSWALVARNGLCAALAVLAMSSPGAILSGWLATLASAAIAVLAVVAYLVCEAVISNAQWMAGED
jgi:hypothetical protein